MPLRIAVAYVPLDATVASARVEREDERAYTLYKYTVAVQV